MALGACGGGDPGDPPTLDAGDNSSADAAPADVASDAVGDGDGSEAGPPYQAPASAREDRIIDDGWRFLPGDAAGAEAVGFDDARWSAVQIPHTWNVEDGQDG